MSNANNSDEAARKFAEESYKKTYEIYKASQDASNVFSKQPIQVKITLLVIIAAICYFIYKYYAGDDDNKNPLDPSIFMTGIKQDKPHTCKNIYGVDDKPYIPDYEVNNQYTNQHQSSYQFWIMIRSDEWTTYKYGSWKHILHRGNNTENYKINEIHTQNPGIYLEPYQNNMVFVFDTENNKVPNSQEKVVLEDVPMNKWFNVCLTIDYYSITIYLDGKLLINRTLTATAKNVTNNNILVNIDGGFSGNMAFLKIYQHAFPPQTVFEEYKKNKDSINSYIEYSKNKYIDSLEDSELIV